MIEIVEPPDIAACAPCMQPLIWLWSPRRKAWVSFVPTTHPDVIRLHGCRALQDYATWRDMPRRSDPPEEYVEARRAEIARLEKTKTRTDNEEQQ